MVFIVSEDGIITADTLCEFTEKPQGTKRLVGEKHRVRRIFIVAPLLLIIFIPKIIGLFRGSNTKSTTFRTVSLSFFNMADQTQCMLSL